MVVLDELPHTATGKIMKTRLREMFCPGATDPIADPNASDIRHRPRLGHASVG